MGEDLRKQTEQNTKPQRKSFFELADDELLITHDTEQKVHRVVFRGSTVDGQISTNSSVFWKLKSKMEKWSEHIPLNFWKNSSYTLGLSKNGKILIYVKSNLKVFPIEFLRSLKEDFSLSDREIKFLINSLELIELEIAHKINDPKDNLKDAKVKYDLDSLVQKLIAFTDNSQGDIEIELKGDPTTCGNLEFLLRDKLNAILYFAELTKIIFKLTKIQKEQKEIIETVKNGLIFLIDDLLNKRLNKEVE